VERLLQYRLDLRKFDSGRILSPAMKRPAIGSNSITGHISKPQRVVTGGADILKIPDSIGFYQVLDWDFNSAWFDLP
jgi:hypothetical protein